MARPGRQAHAIVTGPGRMPEPELGAPPVRILSHSSAFPGHEATQDAVIGLARSVFGADNPVFEKLLGVYANAGVERRRACMPLDWYRDAHGWAERAALYRDHALDLLQRVSGDLLAGAGLSPRDVDAVVCVSTTGVATPSLESLLADRIGLRPDCQRLPVFGLGCAGGAMGLSRAADLARAKPGRVVMLLVVELCTLTFRPQDITKRNIIGTALFGDGAAGVLLTAANGGAAGDAPDTLSEGDALVGAGGEHQWPDSADIMGWRVEDDGLGLMLARSLPDFVEGAFPDAVAGFLGPLGLTLRDLDGVLVHPGGAKVLTAIERCLSLPPDWLDLSRAVLRDHGNVSAVSVLLVLQGAIAAGRRGRHLMVALGPGFSAGFVLIDL